MGASPLGAGRKRGRGTRYRRRQRMSEINVTPFVDVMLVLLIVFMVAAPLLSVGVPVNLPETAANPLPAEDREAVTVHVDSSGALFLQGVETSIDGFSEQLAAIATERGTSDRVFVRGDESVNYGLMMRVMGALNTHGFNNLGLVGDPGGAAVRTAPGAAQEG